MDKGALIARLAQTEEDRILLARVYDRIMTGFARQIPACTSFLTPREQILVSSLLHGMDVCFFGGTPSSERKICCFVPEYLSEEELFFGENSPLCAVRAEFYAGDTQTNRDVLGSLMGCGIKRETVGDIHVSEGRCDFFVTAEILPYLLQNLESAGRTKLHLRQISLLEVCVPEVKTREIRSTVSSLRLDSIVSIGFGLARAKAVVAIEAGKVTLNHMAVEKPDKSVCAGATIALRGMGKICLSEVGGKTKKDRLSVTVLRYE